MATNITGRDEKLMPLVWIDCEMTGLNPDTEEIIEICCIITDGNLNVLDPAGYQAVIHQPASRLDQMDEWCIRTHGNSGLTAACIASTTTPEEAASSLLAYIKKYVPEPRTGLLAGNSVHCDRAFLRKAPYAIVTDYLHYRILDVSSIHEAARRWAPRISQRAPRKKGLHQAREDILESIEEASYFRKMLFEGREEPKKDKASGGAGGLISRLIPSRSSDSKTG